MPHWLYHFHQCHRCHILLKQFLHYSTDRVVTIGSCHFCVSSTLVMHNTVYPLGSRVVARITYEVSLLFLTFSVCELHGSQAMLNQAQGRAPAPEISAMLGRIPADARGLPVK